LRRQVAAPDICRWHPPKQRLGIHCELFYVRRHIVLALEHLVKSNYPTSVHGIDVGIVGVPYNYVPDQITFANNLFTNIGLPKIVGGGTSTRIWL